MHVLLLEGVQRRQVLGEDAQRPRVVAVEELGVAIGERRRAVVGVRGLVSVFRAGVFHRSGRLRAGHLRREKSMNPRCDVGVIQPDANPVADVEAVEPVHHASFDRRLQQAHPGSLCRRAGDQGVERFADARLQQQRGRRLAHLPLDLGGGVLGDRAVLRQHAERLDAVRARACPRAPP